MIGPLRFGVWILLFNVTTQNNITKTGNNSLKRNSFANGYSFTINDTRTKAIISNKHTRKLFIPKITKECEMIGICEDVPDYPEQHVERLLEQMEKLNKSDYNYGNMEAIYNIMETQMGLKIKTDDYLKLCDSEQKIMAPRAARDYNNKWHFIVNKEKEPQQRFQVEVCTKQNISCASVANFAQGYRGWCQQKYVLRIMTAIDSYGKLLERAFLLPSCCSCVYEAIYK